MDPEWDDCYPIGSCPPGQQQASFVDSSAAQSTNPMPFVESWLADSYHDSGFHSANSSHEPSILVETCDQPSVPFLQDLNLSDGAAVINRFIQTCPSFRSCPESKLLPMMLAIVDTLSADKITAANWDKFAMTIAKDYVPQNQENRSHLVDIAFECGLFLCLMHKLTSLIICHWGRDNPALTDFTLTSHLLDAVSKLTRFASMNQLNVGVANIHMLCSLLTLLLPAKSQAFNAPGRRSVSLSPVIYTSVLSKSLKVICHLARSPANFQHFREQRGLETLHCWQEELWFKLIKQSKSEQVFSYHPLFTENDRVVLEQLRWCVFALVDLSATPNNKHYLIDINADVIWAQISECNSTSVDQKLKDKCDKGRTDLAKDRAQRMPGQMAQPQPLQEAATYPQPQAQQAYQSQHVSSSSNAVNQQTVVIQLRALSFANTNVQQK